MKKGNEEMHWIVSEAAMYFFLYYAQWLLGIQANLWISSLILWALLNIALFFCPFIRKRIKK